MKLFEPSLRDTAVAILQVAQERIAGGIFKDVDPIQSWMTGADTSPEGYTSNAITKPYAQHTTVHRAIKIRAINLSKAPLEVFESEEEDAERVPKHWLPQLMQTPGKYGVRRGTQLVEAIEMYLILRGEAFLWHKDIRRGGLDNPNRPQEIWLLSKQHMQPKTKGGELIAWQYSSPAGSKTLSLEELTFFRAENPYDPIRGLGTLEAAMLEIIGDHRAVVFNKSFFDNSAIPPVIFKAIGTRGWAEQARDRFLLSWEAKLRGANRAGKSAALPPGVDLEVLKLTHKEMLFLESRKFTREQIFSLVGVPPIIGGIYEEASLNNARVSQKLFWHDTMFPEMRYIQTVLTIDLLQRYEPERVCRFKIDKILTDISSQEFKEKLDAAKDLMMMGFKPVDINEKLGLGMSTDDAPWLEVGWLPLNIQTAESALNEFEESNDEEIPEDDDDEKGIQGLPVAGVVDDEVHSTAITIRPFDANALAKHIDKLADQLGGTTERDTSPESDARASDDSLYATNARLWGAIARRYNRSLRSWLWRLQQELLGNLKRLSEQQQAVREPLPEGLDIEILFWDQGAATKRLQKISAPFIETAMTSGADAVAAEAGISIAFDILSPEVQIFQASKNIKLVRVSANVRKRVGAAVAQGIADGESVKGLAMLIRGAFTTERTRALTTARTEMSQSFGGGRFLEMKQAGIKEHTWLASRDDRVRDSHRGLNGKTVLVGQPFKGNLKYPGDMDAAPGESINCRCTSRPKRK